MVMKNQKQTSLRKKIESFYEKQEYLSIQQSPNRARSVTVGTAFGGVIELVMRADAATVWAQMQPVEAIELMEQIAAGCGVEIAMRPKQNFASWRGWEEILEQKIRIEGIEWKGTAPYQLKHQIDNQKNLLKESENSSVNTDEPEKKSDENEVVNEVKVVEKKSRSRKKTKTNITQNKEGKENE